MKNRGFTLIELIMVIAILGILAVAAIPKFFTFTTGASQASIDGVVGAVRDGIAIYRANDMVSEGGSGSYPADLDSNADGSVCASCFSSVLGAGLSTSMWRRETSTTYVANDGTNTTTYTYNPNTGLFTGP